MIAVPDPDPTSPEASPASTALSPFASPRTQRASRCSWIVASGPHSGQPNRALTEASMSRSAAAWRGENPPSPDRRSRNKPITARKSSASARVWSADTSAPSSRAVHSSGRLKSRKVPLLAGFSERAETCLNRPKRQAWARFHCSATAGLAMSRIFSVQTLLSPSRTAARCTRSKATSSSFPPRSGSVISLGQTDLAISWTVRRHILRSSRRSGVIGA